ncbi:SH3 domain-containing protein [Virgibacillus sp. CBA3643]|uniref:SH3 domain-containing protein n=1 Tax=Virgibacillus sp. CBA3643 TaxID=2942278 RepID=UPI0035A2945E
MATALFIMAYSSFMLSVPIHADEAMINEDKLKIRNGPGTEFDQIGQADLDEVYTIIDRQDNWVEIELDEGTGWIITKYITIDSDRQEVTEKNITIHQANTQLRNGPSTDYDIIHFANVGDKYDVISEKGDWYEITTEDFTGFVLKKLVDDENQEISSSSSGFENKTIVIDAGHGGHDVGAIGASGVFENCVLNSK